MDSEAKPSETALLFQMIQNEKKNTIKKERYSKIFHIMD